MRLAISCCIVLMVTSVSTASNWPQWRGPFFNGSTDETGLPEKWSRTENVAWVADLPGASAATPIVWDDAVFISAADHAADTLVALCLDRKTGRRLWQHEIAHGIRKDRRSTFAAPSPVTDGQRAIFFYGNGDLVAFDFTGKPLWRRNIQKDYGEFAFLWTFSSSPTLFDGTLYLQVLQRDVAVEGRGFEDRPNESYLLAIDPKSGKTLWRHVRPSQAVAESREAFSTPIPFEFRGRKELLVAGGDDLTGHDPATGRELWRWGTWNTNRIRHWRLVPSPVAGGGVILACAPKRSPIYSVRAGGAGRLSDNNLAWVSNPRVLTSDVPTPAFYDGDFFILSDLRRSLSRVQPGTGQVKWTAQTPGRVKYEASPLAADGKIYIVNFDGDVSVFDAETGRLLRTISMDARSEFVVRSSIVAAHGHLFIRTTDKLYCVGRQRP